MHQSIVRTIRLAGVVAAGLTLAAAPAGGQHVERRGGETTLRGEILSMNESGVTLQSDLGAEHFVPWDRVQHVHSPGFERDYDRWRERALMLWRARSRVERGDHALAEPLLERLFEQYKGRTHETALVVAEGLLRCRLARGAHDLALLPSLEVMRLRRAEVRTLSYSRLPALFDASYGLCPVLAPYWIDSPTLGRVLNEASQYTGYGDEVVQTIAQLYAESLRRVTSPSAEAVIDVGNPDALPDHPGVRFLADLLRLESSDTGTRNATRNRLTASTARVPRFAQAWTRFFVGLSMMNESGVIRQERGMVDLLHLPAAFGSDQKYLAGVALRIVAEALDRRGEVVGAESLRGELATRYPFHPIRFAPPERLGLSQG